MFHPEFPGALLQPPQKRVSMRCWDTLPSNLIIDDLLTSSRPLGLNYDPPLRPAFPSPTLPPGGFCHGQTAAGGEATVTPKVSGAAVLPARRSDRMETAASEEGQPCPSTPPSPRHPPGQGGRAWWSLHLVHSSVPITAHFPTTSWCGICSLPVSSPSLPAAPSFSPGCCCFRPVPPLGQRD